MLTPFVDIKILNEYGRVPVYKTDGSACADIFSAVDVHIRPYGQWPVATGIALSIPNGYKGTIKSRSGMAFKDAVFAFEGTIDSDYRGEVKVLIINNGASPYVINKGDRIAQLAIEEAPQACFLTATTLSDTDRGGNGFGSTGK